MLYWFLKFFCIIPFWLLFPVVRRGEKLPKGKMVIIANHKSNFDPVIVFAKVWRTMHIVGKKELFSSPIKRFFFKRMRVIPVDREKLEMSTVKQSLKVLKDEGILTIFPEGTRNKTDKPLLELKSGAGVFAYKSGAPIVPMWIDKKPRLFRLTKIYVGEPFYLTKENYNDAENIMTQKMLELREMSITKKSPKK